MQIAREALINAGHAYALLIPSIVDEYTDLGHAVDAVFTRPPRTWPAAGFANMCPVASVAAEVADTVEELRETSASVFGGWIDGGSGYFAARGLDASQAREVTLALIGALEGASLRSARCAAPSRCSPPDGRWRRGIAGVALAPWRQLNQATVAIVSARAGGVALVNLID